MYLLENNCAYVRACTCEVHMYSQTGLLIADIPEAPPTQWLHFKEQTEICCVIDSADTDMMQAFSEGFNPARKRRLNWNYERR